MIQIALGEIEVLSEHCLLALSSNDAASFTYDVTFEEIFSAFNYMPRNKSLGPDGFSVEFFIATWEITEDLITSTVKEFFDTGKY